MALCADAARSFHWEPGLRKRVLRGVPPCPRVPPVHRRGEGPTEEVKGRPGPIG